MIDNLQFWMQLILLKYQQLFHRHRTLFIIIFIALELKSFNSYLVYCVNNIYSHIFNMGNEICPSKELLSGVVSNESKYIISYVILSQKMKLKKKRIQTNQSLQAKLSKEKITVNGDININLKENIVKEQEGDQSQGRVKVFPGCVVFQSLQNLEPNKHYISLFLHIDNEIISLIQNCPVKSNTDISLKIRDNKSFKNMDSDQVAKLKIKNSQGTLLI